MSNGQIVEISKLKAPKILYKFRDYNNKFHVNSLFKNEIYIPSANTFNDPQDANLPFRYRKEDLTPANIYLKCRQLAQIFSPQKDEESIERFAYTMNSRNALENDGHLEAFDKLERERINNNFGIMCLTPDICNFLMWSYYANSHCGFAIGYDTEKLINSKLFGMGGKVIYSGKIPEFPLFPDETDLSFFNIFYHKSKVWKHEKEYRLIHIYKNGKVHKIDPFLIKEIVFGCKFSDIDILTFTEKIMQYFPHVIISKMELNKNSFGITKRISFDENLVLKFSKD